MAVATTQYDIAVVGAGPGGVAAAAGFAQRGARVLLLEANPRAASRFAGEWLHPRGVAALESLGLAPVSAAASHRPCRGFVVFPDDGSEPVPLPYPDGARGLSCEHGAFVEGLRARIADVSNVAYVAETRLLAITAEDRGVRLSIRGRTGGTAEVRVPRVVGADGRSSRVRDHLVGRAAREAETLSYMAGVELFGVELPHEDYGHVLLGGPGPVLLYRIGPNRLRACLDIPVGYPGARRDAAYLWEAFAAVLPTAVRGAFRRALEADRVSWVANRFRPRACYGEGPIALVGDAVGFFHPLTAAGMSIALGDARAIAEVDDVARYAQLRETQSWVPELLANALYQVFAREDESAVAIRRAVFASWRQHPAERTRTMRLLAGDEVGLGPFGGTFLRMALRAARGTEGDPRSLALRLRSLTEWAQWPVASVLPPHLRARARRGASAVRPLRNLGVLPALGAPAPAPARDQARGVAPRVEDFLAALPPETSRTLEVDVQPSTSTLAERLYTIVGREGTCVSRPAPTREPDAPSGRPDRTPDDVLDALDALLARQRHDGSFGALRVTRDAMYALARTARAYPGVSEPRVARARAAAAAHVRSAMTTTGMVESPTPYRATAWAVEALADAGWSAARPELRRAARYLVRGQAANGCWEEPDARATTTTAIVVRALSRSGLPQADAIDRAVSWLIATPPGSLRVDARDVREALTAYRAHRATRLVPGARPPAPATDMLARRDAASPPGASSVPGVGPRQAVLRERPAPTEADRAFCRARLEAVSRTFARPIAMLDEPLQTGVMCGYLLCRVADTIEDNPHLTVAQRDARYAAFLEVLEEGRPAGRFESLFHGVPGEPAEIALCTSLERVLRVFGALPREIQTRTLRWVAEMTRGMQLYSHREPGDDGFVALYTVEDLERYCYFVAGTVGHMLTDLFLPQMRGAGVEWPLREHAEAFGVGLQLVNILKDVTDDRERHVSFVPRTVCAARALGIDELVDPRRRDHAHAAVAPLFELARRRLDDALQYTLAIPSEHASVRLFCLLPLWMAVRTLMLARGNDAMFTASQPVKISRDEVEGLIADALANCRDDVALRARYDALWRTPSASVPSLAGTAHG